jgi:hypothetical protein
VGEWQPYICQWRLVRGLVSQFRWARLFFPRRRVNVKCIMLPSTLRFAISSPRDPVKHTTKLLRNRKKRRITKLKPQQRPLW